MTAAFSARVDTALADPTLKLAIDRTTGTARAKRAAAVAAWPQFEAARDLGRDIKDHVIANLGFYLAEFERNAKASGAQVHWARTAEEACAIVVGICRDAGAKSVTRAKSMLGEEIGLPRALEEAGNRACRDRSRRAYRPARRRPALPHRLAGAAQDARAGGRAVPPPARRTGRARQRRGHGRQRPPAVAPEIHAARTSAYRARIS